MKKIILFIMIINVLISLAKALPNNNEKLMNSSEMEILNLDKHKFDEILNSDNLVDSVFVYNSNGKTSKYSYNYNKDNQILIITIFQLMNDIWTNDFRITYTFDDSKKIINKLQEDWVSDDWQNYSMTTSKYNLQSNIENDSSFSWNNQRWELTSSIHYYYYDNQYLKFRIINYLFDSNWQTTTWEEYYYNEGGLLIELKDGGFKHDRSILSYNENGKLIKREHQFEADLIGYDNDTKESFFYDEKGNLDSTIFENWEYEMIPDFGEWKKDFKTKYIYDANNKLTQIFTDRWDSVNQWQNANSVQYTYNNRNQLLVELTEIWNTKSGWQLSEKLTYNYDKFYYPIKVISEKFETNNWNNYNKSLSFNDSSGNYFSYTGYKLEIFWNIPTHIDDEIGDDNFVIYPNPARDYIEINSTEFIEEIRIYNALGECVLSMEIHPMASSHRMNIENLPSGFYFVRIGDFVGRFVKL